MLVSAPECDTIGDTRVDEFVPTIFSYVRLTS